MFLSQKTVKKTGRMISTRIDDAMDAALSDLVRQVRIDRSTIMRLGIAEVIKLHHKNPTSRWDAESQTIVNIQQIVSKSEDKPTDTDFDMILYGDDRYEEGIKKFLDFEEDDLSYVYFVQMKDDLSGPVKIGSTISPTGRLSTLNTSIPYELEYLVKFPMPGKHTAKTVEHNLHTAFKEYRIKREWFKRDCLNYINIIMKNIVEHNWYARFLEYRDHYVPEVDWCDGWVWTVDTGLEEKKRG